nr:ATP synthase F0 subunit 8 [Sastragala edessoides]
MPQMSPMWWEILFLFFIIIMMIMMTSIYHNKINYNKKMEMTKSIKHQMMWKW